MDLAAIPRSFWHALSASVLIATCGLVFIAYQSSTVSVEIANAKIQLSSAITDTQGIKSDLERENERLRRASEVLQARIAELEQTGQESSGTGDNETGNGSVPRVEPEPELAVRPPKAELPQLPEYIPQERFREFDMKIQQAQQYLK